VEITKLEGSSNYGNLKLVLMGEWDWVDLLN
jgi:hypothetical protein